MNATGLQSAHTDEKLAVLTGVSLNAGLDKIIWEKIRDLAQRIVSDSPRLALLANSVILNSETMAEGLSQALSRQQFDRYFTSEQLSDLLRFVYGKAPDLVETAAIDLNAVMQRDPAVTEALTPFLYFKGFHALQTHRAAHWLWENGEKDTALFLQNRSSVLYATDIHPAAKIGKGIMLDHATGLVIGETAVVEDDVSMLHNVTLGGTGKEHGDRHPKIRAGVMIGAGAKILGNVEIGTGACIAAGSVVLKNVPPHTKVAGVPAKIIGKADCEVPALEMNQISFLDGEAP
ncbi:MAG: serine O-acetyltransferase [Alphaproteobacteria bacterium]|nr:serine O-acetyltransferase [Alphaproteobacteria bacterium]